MTDELKKEIDNLITKFNCPLNELSEEQWKFISFSQKLSEEFIEKYQDKVCWSSISKYQKLSEPFIKKFENKKIWYSISQFQKLSEEFIEKYQDKVDWKYISEYQKLSEFFIEKYQDKVFWIYISHSQKLSESFIEKFKDLVDWDCISYYQKLSESFIEKYQDKVYWKNISYSQKLSESFIEKFKDRINIEIQLRKHHVKIDPVKEATEYAEKYDLKIEDGYLYAFRNHDFNGCGMYNKTIVYEKDKTYEDWHCNLDKTDENSFGLGIWPKGNTPVKVKLKDFGVYLPNDYESYGKARVWKFTVI